jgi:lipopolysaccharide export system protein LptA
MTHDAPTRPNLSRLALTFAIGGFALTAALAGGMTLNAQAIGSHNSNAPVNYAADRIELQDRENRVILSGNVVIEQAGLTLRSGRTLVNFNDAGSLSIQRITATGGVEITHGDERASGDNAIYDFGRRVITMAGNVRLRRGGDTLNGGRLVIDLNSGLSSVDGSAAGGSSSGSNSGRVTGSFAVPQGQGTKP